MVTSTTTRKGPSPFDELAADIVKSSDVARSLSGAPDLSAEIRFLERHDYGPALRKALSRAEVRQIVAEARSSVWPHLNEESVRLVSPKEFTRKWAKQGVQFRLAKLEGAEGLALLGFYVRKMGGSKLPLICVNTAHHPVAVGATFSHEMGHHLVGQLYNSRKEHAQLLAYTAYGEHLDDPEELAADILVSLGVFPALIARRIFMQPERRRPSDNPAGELPFLVSTTVLNYFERRYGLSFGGTLASTKKLQYLAALIHFAKLRRALLTEYDL